MNFPFFFNLILSYHPQIFLQAHKKELEIQREQEAQMENQKNADNTATSGHQAQRADEENESTSAQSQRKKKHHRHHRRKHQHKHRQEGDDDNYVNDRIDNKQFGQYQSWASLYGHPGQSYQQQHYGYNQQMLFANQL